MIRLIDITDDDIKNGVQCDNNKCAIARALKREYKTDNISVYIPDDISTPILLVNRKELNILPPYCCPTFSYFNSTLPFCTT